MKRSQLILTVLAAVLLSALFFVLLYQPQREALAEVEAQIVLEQAQHVELQADISRLQTVREGAPEVEAELAVAGAIVPSEAALPGALRQLQLSSDESGLVLQSVTTGRPVLVVGASGGLASIDVNVQVEGGYFQVIDFLRRIEDPSITPRGLTWSGLTASRQEYPDLNISLSGRMYTLAPELEAAAPADPAAGPEGTEGAEGAETDADPDAEAEPTDGTDDAAVETEEAS